MRQALNAVDWSESLKGDVNEQWATFASVIKSVESLYIPLKNRSQCKKKAPWMSYKAVKLVERKHKIYKKYKSTTHPAYMKAAQEA